MTFQIRRWNLFSTAPCLIAIAITSTAMAQSSPDCNGNGIPDETDIASHRKSDCNENGIPDDCDIAAGNAVDTNGDGFPDDCACLVDQKFLPSPESLPPTPPESLEFGFDTAIDDGVAVIGSRWPRSGRVAVYRRTGETWLLETELMPSLPDTDFFGFSVDIEDDRIVVSAQIDDVQAVYLYRHDAASGLWIEDAVLVDTLNESVFWRAGAVGISGNVILHEHPFTFSDSRQAAVVVYRFDPATSMWNEETRLSELTWPGFSGQAMDVDGDVIVLGNAGDTVLVYRYDPALGDWIEDGRFELVSFGCGSSGYGTTVGISGNAIIVGSPSACYLDAAPPTLFSGAADVFRYNGADWIKEARLFPANLGLVSGLRYLDGFGKSVSIDGDVAVVAVENTTEYDNGTQFGSAFYVFRKRGDQWIDDALVRPTIFTDNELFGWNIAMSGDDVVAGTPRTDELAVDSGSVYFFSGLVSPDTDDDGIPDACALVVGDIDRDGMVGIIDFLAVLANWGPCPAGPTPCPADYNGDGEVGILEFLLILANWS